MTVEQDYVSHLQHLFKGAADPVQAGPMNQYMRGQFDFLGIKSPQRKSLLRTFIADQGLPPLNHLQGIIRLLWQLPEREYQYAAVDLLSRLSRQLAAEDIELLEYAIVSKSWWDTVDGLASHPVGDLFRRDRQIQRTTVARWRQSSNLWLRRTTLLFQLRYKDQTDAALLFDLVLENGSSREFFIQKAIGWALRQYSKTAPEAVAGFVATTDLSGLSEREALKWLKAQDKIV